MITMKDLGAVRAIKLEVEAYEILLRRVETSLASLTALAQRFPNAKTFRNKIELLTLKKLSYEERIEKLRGRLEETALALATRICQEVEDETAQTLLLLRYVECLSWTQVAERMNYDRRYVFKLHKKTLAVTT